MSILTGPEIARLAGVPPCTIYIDPFDRTQLNPASYDLRLGDRVAVYTETVYGASRVAGGFGLSPRRAPFYTSEFTLDAKKPHALATWTMTAAGWVLLPGILYLMHTVERIRADRHVVVIDGKSSLGRLGVSCHQTAGYGDQGFDGQYTLEVTAAHAVRVYPGMRFCQARFMTLEGDVQPYAGHYVGDTASGPVASRSWKQFEDEEKKA